MQNKVLCTISNSEYKKERYSEIKMGTYYDSINTKIDNMKSLKDKIVLKELIREVFIESNEYHNELINNLQKKINEEITVSVSSYDIMTAVCPREEFDSVNGVFFSMKAENDSLLDFLNGKKMSELNQMLRNEGRVFIGEIFIEADYLILKELIDSQEVFDGLIYTEHSQYKMKVQLIQNLRYLKMLKELKEYYVRNHIEDKVINSPYLFKFFDVFIIDMDNEPQITNLSTYSNDIQKHQPIINIDYQLGEYEIYRKNQMLPLWNIEIMSMSSSFFPIPQENEIYYRSDITIDNLVGNNDKQGEDGYLIMLEEGFDGYVAHYRDRLSVFSKYNMLETWSVIRVINPTRNKEQFGDYPIITNGLKKEFMHRYAERYQRNIRTEAELERKLKSYIVSDSINYLHYEIADTIAREETYQLLEPGIHESKSRKYMLVYFEKRNCPDFIVRDIISFLLSEVAQIFPEYYVVGKLE